tara:strand:+ start:602 stop:1048 length:447 start_codon:yes stop_codon:yes gene_type:complete
VSECSFGGLADDPEFDGLVAEYALESKIKGMPPINWAREMYESMEGAGIVHCLALRDTEEKLVGFAILLCTVYPHYSKLAVTAESLFVTRKYRQGGSGMKLIKQIEAHGKNIGAVGILLSAPHGGSLESVAPRIGYQQTNSVFFKAVP